MATEKIYKCGHCGTTNDSLESLKQHMLSTHMSSTHLAPQLEPASGDAPMQQQVIPQLISQETTESSSSIVTHPKFGELPQVSHSQVSSHPGPTEMRTKPPGRFKCGHCGIIVTTMDKLKSHMLTTHVNDQTGEYAGQQPANQQPSLPPDSPEKGEPM